MKHPRSLRPISPPRVDGEKFAAEIKLAPRFRNRFRRRRIGGRPKFVSPRVENKLSNPTGRAIEGKKETIKRTWFHRDYPSDGSDRDREFNTRYDRRCLFDTEGGCDL